MTDIQITQADRELLAEEYERADWPLSAVEVRKNSDAMDAKASLRAIARARIGREEAVSGDAGWQPIASAPKDREIIVGQRGATGMYITQWNEIFRDWLSLPQGLGPPDVWREKPAPPPLAITAPPVAKDQPEANTVTEATGEARKAPVAAPTPEQFEALCRAVCVARGINPDEKTADALYSIVLPNWTHRGVQWAVRDWLAMRAKARELGL